MEKRKESVIMNKEKQLYNYIKSTFIDEHIKKDYEEKTKYTKEIIKKCKEEYSFEDETVIKIFKRIYYSTEKQSRLNNYNKDFMIGMASVWNRNNIKTKEDIDNYYKNLYNEIFNIIMRDLTTYEKIELENLIYKYEIDEKLIISKIKEEEELNINKLKEELLKIIF